MRNILFNLLNPDSKIINLIGEITFIFPTVLFLGFIVHYLENIESRRIYKFFKLPQNIKEYKKIKNISKALVVIIIQISMFSLILLILVLYYLIYYGIYLPRFFGVQSIL